MADDGVEDGCLTVRLNFCPLIILGVLCVFFLFLQRLAVGGVVVPRTQKK